MRGEASLQTVLLLFCGGLLVISLLAAFATSYGHFREYVFDQLAAHARDGATAAGLSLSNAIDGSDPVASASLVDAVYDSGNYLSVEYLGHDGEPVAVRSEPLRPSRAPEWFVALAELPLPVAEAEVVRGWSRLGKVRVVGHPGRAYDDLWQITLGLLVASLATGGAGLTILYLVLTRALRPLREVEAQARAIGQRDFRIRVQTRSTRELNRVSEAMNQMADDLGQLFEGQGKLIQHLRKVNNEDPVTGLASRGAFDQRVKVEVESEEKSAAGVLILIQLANFASFNAERSREEGDQLLRLMAGQIQQFVTRHPESIAGRRTGAEFAIFVPGASGADVGIWADELVQTLHGLYAEVASPLEPRVHAGLAIALPGAGIRDVLAAADEALRQAQQKEHSCSLMPEQAPGNHHNVEVWRTIISQAIREDNLSLWVQPMVRGDDKGLLHYQVFSRINTDEGALKAGLFVPMAERLGMMPDIDRMLVERVLAHLGENPSESLAISLSGASISDDEFRGRLLGMLAGAGRDVERLWVGIPEIAIHHHRKEVGGLIRELFRRNVPVVVDRFGVGGVPFSYLRRLPLSAVRIDHSFVRDVDSHEENRFWLESVVGIAHSRGVKVYATGVETAAEYSVLCKLGIDGAMGYHLGRPFAADQ